MKQPQIPPFVHLHVHSTYSRFDGMTDITELLERCEELGMPGVALTDHGNMFGIKEFFEEAKKHPSVKPIAGCEFYLIDHYAPQVKDLKQQKCFHLILLAKNKAGYDNLQRLTTEGLMQCYYDSRPHIWRELLERYHEGIICTSACLGGEVAQAILDDDLDGARKAISWYKKVFGDDFYLEVDLHSNIVEKRIYPKQQTVAKWVFILGHEMKVKVIAANDVHFLTEDEAPFHDLMLCEKTHSDPSDPDRFRYTGQEWLKSAEEMYFDFCFHPEAMENTMEIFNKIERYDI